MLNYFEMILAMKSDYEKRKVKRDQVGEYTIDTAWTDDCGYETAIWKDHNEMIVVENYDTKEESEQGHKKWCEFCKYKPKEAYSVQLKKMVKF